MPVILRCGSQDNLPLIARKILLSFKNRRVFAFSGSMGAGKTSLIQQLCKELGVADFTVSPTFSLVNEYRDQQGAPVYHFDFYRINHIREAYDMGYEEYFFSGHYCFIEWPEMIMELLPPDCVYIRIEIDDLSGERSFEYDPE
jgi:tRNA threonylcarbamoyladenosine biosynthesis protein TsaE